MKLNNLFFTRRSYTHRYDFLYDQEMEYVSCNSDSINVKLNNFLLTIAHDEAQLNYDAQKKFTKDYHASIQAASKDLT